jgi:hypothetical protein
MKIHTLLLGLGAWLLTALSAFAQTNYYLKMDRGLTGSVVAEGFVGAFDVQSFSMAQSRGASAAGGGPVELSAPSISELSVNMSMDTKGYAALFAESLVGDDEITSTLSGVTGGGENRRTFMEYEVKGYITGLSIQGVSGDQMFVTMTIFPRKVKVTTLHMNPDTTVDTATKTYNLATQMLE